MDAFSRTYLCDTEVVEEAYTVLPHEIMHRDQEWVLGPIKQIGHASWSISVYALEGTRKRLHGELGWDITLAGLTVELDDRGRQSPVARTAFNRLVQEINFILGLDDGRGADSVADEQAPLLLEPQTSDTAQTFPRLVGPQLGQFSDALEAAFSEGELQRLVRVHFSENLHSIAGGSNYREKVFQLVEWAQRTGQIEKLMDAALHDNVSNAALADLVKLLRP